MRLGTGLATAKLGGTTVASIRRGANTVYDADATTYLKAVEAADGQGLEPAVAKAIQDFVVGLKATSAGIAADPTRTLWDAVQASCIMCGARTISGALVPLKGTAPTPYNLVNFDYTRTGGIEGDGSSTYLDSNRSNDADGQDDAHLSVYVTANAGPGIQFLAGAGGTDAGASSIGFVDPAGQMLFRSRNQLAEAAGSAGDAGFFGSSRSEDSAYVMRASGANTEGTYTSQTPYIGSVYIFSRNSGTAYPTDATLAFYSIGSALDLAALDTKVTALVAAVSAALA